MTALRQISQAIKDHLLGSGVSDAFELNIDCSTGDFDIILCLPDMHLSGDAALNLLQEVVCLNSAVPIAQNTYLLTVEPDFWAEIDHQQALRDVLNKIGPVGNGRMNVEFVSAYPTGPLRHEHFQSGVFGDVIARIFEWAGWDISREFYVNDSGLQAETNARVLQAFALSVGNDEADMLPPEISNYLSALWAAVKAEFGADVFQQDEAIWLPKICAFSVDQTLSMFTDAMKSIGTRFDTFAHEKTLLQDCDESELLDFLSQAGALQRDEGETLTLCLPGVEATAERILRSKNQTWTYVFSDVVLHRDKLERGFDGLITLLNAQHAGYEKFIGSLVELLAGERQPLFRARALKPFNAAFKLPEQSDVDAIRWAYLTAALPMTGKQNAHPTQELSRLVAIWPDVLEQITTTCEVENLAAFANRLALTLEQCDPQTAPTLLNAGAALRADVSKLLGVDAVHFAQLKPASQA